MTNRDARVFRTIRNALVDILPPLVSRQIARHVMPRLGLAEHQPVTSETPSANTPLHEKVKTVSELDSWIERANRAGEQSDDAMRQIFSQFEFDIEIDMPKDPYSPEYRDAQMAMYSLISGRKSYESLAQEETPFDHGEALRRPFPYATQSSNTVGEQLMLQGMLIRKLALRPGARVVEFGPGWGNLTLELAKMGMKVTAVDVYPGFSRLLASRAQQLGLEIEIVTADMLQYRAQEPFEAAVFFESFHHCSDHQQMLRNLRAMVRDDGIVAFGAEPIGSLPYPWGLRLDGMAVWSIRRFGWLENGFTEAYFLEVLRRTGWRPTISYGQDVAGSLVVARKEAKWA